MSSSPPPPALANEMVAPLWSIKNLVGRRFRTGYRRDRCLAWRILFRQFGEFSSKQEFIGGGTSCMACGVSRYSCGAWWPQPLLPLSQGLGQNLWCSWGKRSYHMILVTHGVDKLPEIIVAKIDSTVTCWVLQAAIGTTPTSSPRSFRTLFCEIYVFVPWPKAAKPNKVATIPSEGATKSDEEATKPNEAATIPSAEALLNLVLLLPCLDLLLLGVPK